MTKIPKLKILFLFSTFYFLLFSAPTLAAELSLTSQTQKIGIDQQFQVDLLLNTENEYINAVEGKIIFPTDLLELKEIRDGNSIINFWIDPVRNCVSNGVERPDAICFSGIIPGGYQETKGFLFSLVFQARASGSSAIEIRGAKVLLNDGKGTSANLSIINYQLSISEETSSAPLIVETVKDTDPPEEFKPEIAQSPEIFDGKYFLVFVTQDKGSGIDHYEVCEGNKKKCVIAESPYLLKDQKLKSYIYIKAIDKVGNERIAVVEPQYPMRWYEFPLVWVIIILGFIALYIVKKLLWQKFIKSR